MSENPFTPSPTPLDSTAAKNAPRKNDGVDTTGILLIGSFTVLVVVFLVLALDAYFHHYRHALIRQRMANIGAWAARVQARQQADLAPHWTDATHRHATVGIRLAEQMVVAGYTPGAAPVLLAAAPTATPTARLTPPVAKSVPLHLLGAQLAQTMGCTGCHSVNGQPGAGPTWKNLAGYPQHLTNGKTKIADYAFLRFMILHPGKLVVKGFPPIMPDIYYAQLAGPKHPHQRKLNALIWYINTLSDRSSQATRPPVPDK